MRWGGCRAMRQIDGSCVLCDARWIGCAPSCLSGLPPGLYCDMLHQDCDRLVLRCVTVISSDLPWTFGGNIVQDMASLGLDTTRKLVGLCLHARSAIDVTSRQRCDGDCEGCGCCVTSVTTRRKKHLRGCRLQRLQPNQPGLLRGSSLLCSVDIQSLTVVGCKKAFGRPFGWTQVRQGYLKGGFCRVWLRG